MRLFPKWLSRLCCPRDLAETLGGILTHQREIMTKLNELVAELQDIKARFQKGTAEVVDHIRHLKDLLTDVELPGEAVAVLAELKESGDALNAIVPDASDPPVQAGEPAG